MSSDYFNLLSIKSIEPLALAEPLEKIEPLALAIVININIVPKQCTLLNELKAFRRYTCTYTGKEGYPDFKVQ